VLAKVAVLLKSAPQCDQLPAVAFMACRRPIANRRRYRFDALCFAGFKRGHEIDRNNGVMRGAKDLLQLFERGQVLCGSPAGKQIAEKLHGVPQLFDQDAQLMELRHVKLADFFAEFLHLFAARSFDFAREFGDRFRKTVGLFLSCHTRRVEPQVAVLPGQHLTQKIVVPRIVESSANAFMGLSPPHFGCLDEIAQPSPAQLSRHGAYRFIDQHIPLARGAQLLLKGTQPANNDGTTFTLRRLPKIRHGGAQTPDRDTELVDALRIIIPARVSGAGDKVIGAMPYDRSKGRVDAHCRL